MKRRILIPTACFLLSITATAQTSFTAGNLVVLQTSGTLSKEASAATLKEYSTSGTAGFSVAIPSTGPTPFQTAGAFGGSEGFLTTSLNGKFLVLAGYGTPAYFTDITATTASAVPRVVGTVTPSGIYMPVASSNTFYSANDIRGAVSDSINFWASGASAASVDGIDYFGPGAQVALATGTTPAKAYGLRIFNGQIFYSTQKAGPSNTATQLGIFTLGGLPTSGTVTPAQVINTGAVVPQDFSFNAAGDVCYIAIPLNTSAGGIQKWTKTGAVWSLAYTLGTGITNTGAYGLVVDYSGTAAQIYATTFDATGNRIVKITDNGTLASAGISTIVAATAGTYYKGITFAPASVGTPTVNLSVSTDTASENGQTVVIVKANTSFAVSSAQTISLGVSGAGITSGDYILTGNTITIPAGASFGVDTFKIVDDALVEGTETATLTLSNPSSGIVIGTTSSKIITITDNDAPAPPTISLNVAATSNFIDGGVTVALASPFKVSGVVADPTDPAATFGIDFSVGTTQALGALTVSATSSNTSVVPGANIVISGAGNTRNVKITAAGVGYSNITIKVNDGFDSSTYVIAYAASAASGTPAKTFWHTGMSDGSDAIAIDENYFISGDDEINVLNVYPRAQSGLPLVSYNYSSNLALPDPAKPEADIEAATRSFVNPGRVYWAGSMSNGKAPFDNKPNRDRIFATTVSGTGASTTFTFAGWAALKTSLLAWGDANGYNFTASAAQGVDSKLLNGYAVEGMVFGPDSTTLYIGFRAPLVPTAARTKAVIAPIKNFETWFNNGAPSGSPVFGAPIELNLGNRGIRDLTRLSNGTYIIIAGDPGPAKTGAIYKWSGKATDTAIRMPQPAVDTLNMEGVMQVNTAGQSAITGLQIITDKGGDILYNDGMEAKDFGDLQLRKFRSDVVTSLDLTLPLVSTGVPASPANAQVITIYPNASEGPVNIRFAATEAEDYNLVIVDMSGRVVFQKSAMTQVGANVISADLSRMAKGFYNIRLRKASLNYSGKLLLK